MYNLLHLKGYTFNKYLNKYHELILKCLTITGRVTAPPKNYLISRHWLQVKPKLTDLSSPAGVIITFESPAHSLYHKSLICLYGSHIVSMTSEYTDMFIDRKVMIYRFDLKGVELWRLFVLTKST